MARGCLGRISSNKLRAALAVLVAGCAVAADPTPDATAILERAEEVRSPVRSFAVDFEIEITDPSSSWKRRTASYSMIAAGKDHSLVLMREPEEFHPGLLLIEDDRYWLLLPRSQRPLQLSPRHVLNGDIANGDLARGNLIAHYEPRRDGIEEVGGKSCYRLDLTRADERAMYERIRLWVTRESSLPSKLEYYGKTGTLLKTALYEDYREGPIGLRAMRIVVRNHVRPDERTVLTFTNLRATEADPAGFTPAALVSMRQVALDRKSSSTSPVRPEDLLEPAPKPPKRGRFPDGK